MDTDPRLDPRICAQEAGASKTIRTASAQRPRIKEIIAPPGFLIVKSASRQSPTGRSPDCVANAYGTFSPSSASFSPLWTVFSRSEEHTSELQSLTNLVCRLLLEKKKKNNT